MSEKLEKQPREYFPITVDYSSVLDTSETITSGSWVYAYENSTGIEVSGSTIVDTAKTTWGDNYLQTYVQSGSLNTTYRLEFVAKTSDGKYYEQDVFVNVRN